MNLLAHRSGRRLSFALLYFCEGAPIGLIWWALPTLLRLEGVALERITGLTAMVVLPWTLKFLWAPLVDALRGPRWGYRAWIGSAQLTMAITLTPLAWLDPGSHFSAWQGLLLVHAFAAATQDVAIDALAINSVPDQERGTLNGAMQAGMLIGRSAFGGGALLVSSVVGRGWVVGALVACIAATLVLLLFLAEPASPASPRRPRARFGTHLLTIARARATWIALAFALTGAAAFESAGQLAGPFLVDRGVSPRSVGLFFGVVVVVTMAGGGLLGGWLSDRWGRRRSVAAFLAGFVVTIALLGLTDIAGGAPPGVLLGLLGATYLFIGLFTAASYALFMDLTAPAVAATQFSVFMAATNGCEAWSGWAGGRFAAAAGYGPSFLVMCGVSLLSLPFLGRLAPRPGQQR